MFCFVCLFVFFFPPFLGFALFFFPEFIHGVCGLRWRIEAYYIECTTVVKKWDSSDCDNRGYPGRWGWFFKLSSARATARSVRKQIWDRRRVGRLQKYVLAEVRIDSVVFFLSWIWWFDLGWVPRDNLENKSQKRNLSINNINKMAFGKSKEK